MRTQVLKDISEILETGNMIYIENRVSKVFDGFNFHRKMFFPTSTILFT